MENYTSNEGISSEMRNALLPVTVFIGIEIVVGFIGNITILYLFLCKYHECSYRYFVISLASYDFISMLTTIPGEIIQHRYALEYPSTAVCKVKTFFSVLTVGGSGLTFLAISVDRYRKVCRPLGWQLKPRHASLLCVIIFIIAFAYSVPVTFLIGIYTNEVQSNNVTILTTICDNDKEYLGADVFLALNTGIGVMLSVSLLGMFVLYSIIVKKLILGKNKILKSRKQCAELKAETSQGFTLNSTEDQAGNTGSTDKKKMELCWTVNHSGEVGGATWANEANYCKNSLSSFVYQNKILRKKTLVMFVVSAIYFTTTALYIIFKVIDKISQNLKNMTTTELAVFTFFLRLVFINHVINPFVYYHLDPEFRKLMFNCGKYFQRCKH